MAETTAFHDIRDRRFAFAPANALQFGDIGEVACNDHLEIKRHTLRQIAHALLHFQGVCMNVVSRDRGGSAGGGMVTRENPHRRGLTGAVGSKKADNFTGLNVERNGVYRANGPVGFRQILYFNHGYCPLGWSIIGLRKK